MNASSTVGAISVAVLEDHVLLRETLTKGLQTMDMNIVVSTALPSVFFEAMTAHPPQVALIDLTLDSAEQNDTEKKGLGALARLTREFQSVRAIVFTADHRRETQARCQDAGAWGFMSKLRTDAAELATAVRRVAAGERYGETGQRASGTPLPAVRPPLSVVSRREHQVLSFVSTGAGNDRIAAQLGISVRTVRAHLSNLYSKLGAENRTQLALMAQQLGVLPPQID